MASAPVKRPTGALRSDIVVGRKGGSPPFLNGRDTEGVDPSQMRLIIETGKRIFPQVSPYIIGKPPHVQAGMLADVTALWLVAYPAQERDGLIKVFTRLVEQLTDLNAKILAGQVTLY